MLKFIEEFKKFAIKGNAVDLAVGVVIGTAFGKIVSSLVSDVIMPSIGIFTGGTDFSNLVWTISSNPFSSNVAVIKYGMFLNALVDFILIALSIFVVVKVMNNLMRKEEIKEKAERKCPYCQSTIHKKAKKCPNCTADL